MSADPLDYYVKQDRIGEFWGLGLIWGLGPEVLCAQIGRAHV